MRDDISNRLIHFIRGNTPEESFHTLNLILREQALLGGTGYIRGHYKCVCFSEAPVSKLGYILSSPNKWETGSSYQPFGIMVSKEWLFNAGGRPVIYQPASEFDFLDDSIKWRHVTYEPDSIDFSWEREWRIKTDRLPLPPNETTIVVPSKRYIDDLLQEHYSDMEYAVAVLEEAARQYIRPYPWHYIILEDLGIDI
jgi:hypothetical protein